MRVLGVDFAVRCRGFQHVLVHGSLFLCVGIHLRCLSVSCTARSVILSKSRLERSMFFMHGDLFYGRCAARAPWPKSRLEKSMFFMHEGPSYGWCAAQALWLKSSEKHVYA